MKEVLQSRLKEIEAVELTPEEVKQAIMTAKTVKWNYLRNKEYWDEQQRKLHGKQIGQ